MTTPFEPPENFYSRNPQSSGRKSRAAPSYLVAIGIMVLFSAIIWIAYPEESERTEITSLPVVQADAGSYKARPDQPGGIDIPHQDNEMFTLLEPAGGEGGTQAVVEQLLPRPEEPVDRQQALGTAEPTDAAIAAADAEKAVSQLNAAAQAPVTEEKPKVIQMPAVDPVAEHEKAVENFEVAAAEPVTTPVDKAVKERSAPAVAKAKSGDYLIQLGSVSSEAGAKQEWKRLQKKVSSLKDLDLSIQRADLGAKGVYYRVRAGSLAKADAERICADVKARNAGGCIVVRP